MLNYFWTSVNGGRGRQHLMDGTTVEHSYSPGETRHETYGPGEFKVHDLENLGDEEMIFNTIEFLDSANKPLPVPDRVRLAGLDCAHMRDCADSNSCRPARALVACRHPRVLDGCNRACGTCGLSPPLNGLAKPPSILHTAADKPLGKRQNKP